jgi:hypothetical protein
VAQLPLIIFPKPKKIPPPKGTPFPPSKPHFPDKKTQITRLSPQFNSLADEGILGDCIEGAEPEMVLVIETVGRIDKFQTAIANTPGLEWLAEWDEEFESDSNFYNTNKKGSRIDKPVEGRLFLSMSNQQGLNEILSLWGSWQNNQVLPLGKGKWKEAFEQIKTIRRWGIQEQLVETGVLEIWEEDLKYASEEVVNFQIEFFYRKDKNRRTQNENTIKVVI